MNHKSNKKAVIFDFDGTIALSEPLHINAWIKVVENLNKNLPENFHHEILGKSDVSTAKMLVDFWGDSQPYQDLVLSKQQQFKEVINKGDCPLVEGALEILRHLARRMPIALATSSTWDEITPIFEFYKLKHYFNEILTVDIVENPKPNPEMYQKAAARLNMEPQNCWVFEDSIHGINAANSAKMNVIGLTTSLTKSQMPPVRAAIKDFTDLKQIEHLVGFPIID